MSWWDADCVTPVALCQPRSAQIGGGGGYEIPNIPENKTRCGLGLERIKIRENVAAFPEMVRGRWRPWKIKAFRRTRTPAPLLKPLISSLSHFGTLAVRQILLGLDF
jgi:hypothetical protein